MGAKLAYDIFSNPYFPLLLLLATALFWVTQYLDLILYSYFTHIMQTMFHKE